ncbi:hypothetical protein skT53_16040 [Effusibacillus dendaii]|uniref:Type II secretion system protein GspF domain-containing protein n=2 Tax=Effusibacillus dendaii TaxID=2743772 RepID=A0A7I8DCC4_9BACL|nr:hypothetical protein skT53_16040 [Effusibacillus dendaii]
MAVLLHPSISPTTRQKIQRQLINAGLEDVYTVEGMYGLKSLTAAGCLAYFVLLGIKAGSLFIGMGILAASFGYWLPNLWLRQKINRRKRQIRREFPYILSTLAVMSEAGLQLFPALQGTVGTGKGEVVQELRRVVKDASFGMALAESLQRMAHRCQVEEVNRFVSAVTQNLERGTGIAQVLRKQSVELWNTRKKKAQQLGQQASLKMFFPLLLLVFPAIIIFILGPVLIQAAKFLMQP